MPGLSELHEALQTAWISTGLKTQFEGYWSSGDRVEFESLNDGEAAPGTPFPYCVFETPTLSVVGRMSGGCDVKYQTADIPLTFKIYAKGTSSYSGKEIALTLAERVLKYFGGHPNPANTPISLPMDNNGFLITQYSRDFPGGRKEEETYLWVIEYTVKIDMPIAV